MFWRVWYEMGREKAQEAVGGFIKRHPLLGHTWKSSDTWLYIGDIVTDVYFLYKVAKYYAVQAELINLKGDGVVLYKYEVKGYFNVIFLLTLAIVSI